MIDRITFYIKDVDLESVEKLLGLLPSEIDKSDSFIFTGKIRNLKVKYAGKRLMIDGSLHKFAKGNNFCLFTYEEAKSALIEISEIVGIPLNRFIVTKIELGLNIIMEETPKKYIDIIHSYQGNRFILMSPLNRTSKLMGCRCNLSEYGVKFYDKTFEVFRTEKIAICERLEIPSNILRYEIQLSRKQLKYEGFRNVTGKNLLNNLHNICLKRLMNRIFQKIEFKDFSLDYSKLLQEEVKRYIFVLSDSYDHYLNYLNENIGHKEYRKERRTTNDLLKKVAPFKTGKLETELKSNFKTAISKI
jgi:hypothetical protein